MKTLIGHITSAVLLATKRRSSKWPAVEKQHLHDHPQCAACDGVTHLQVHHLRPYHIFPDLELDPNNLITLCEQPGLNCHLLIGHGGNFRAWNPSVTEDAAQVLARPESRMMVVDSAKTNRRFA